jgi:periplasmic divalent cation tolerance protein
MDLVSISITGPDVDTLAGITHHLIEDRLVACGNIIPTIRSIYRWQGTIEDEAEAYVLLHTQAGHIHTIIDRVNAEHPYDTVQILATVITEADPAYRQWVLDQTEGPAGA